MASHMASVALFGQQDERSALVQLRHILHERKYLSRDQISGKKVLVIGIGGMGSVVAQMLRAMAAQVDVVCSSDADDLAQQICDGNVFHYDSYEYKDDLIEAIRLKSDEKYQVVIDCARSDTIEESSIGWVGAVSYTHLTLPTKA